MKVDRAGIREIASELRANWGVLLSATLGTGLGAPAIYYYTVGIFMSPLRSEFGWSASALSTTTTVVLATIAVMSPIIGRIVDRFGAHRIGPASMLLFAAGFWGLSEADGVFSHYLLTTILLAIGASGTTAVCFVRMLVSTFTKARGTAIGIALAAIGVSVAIFPQIAQGIVAAHGWRCGYRFLAILLIVAVPIVAFAPRGKRSVSSEPGSANMSGQTIREAMAGRTFWLMALAFFTSAAAVGGTIISFVPFLTVSGMTVTAAVKIASVLGIALIFGRLMTGLLLDRVPATKVAAVFFAAGALGCLLLLAPSPATGVVAAFLIGSAMGAEVDIAGYLTAQHFGQRHFSGIYGWQYAIFSVGAALGPLAAGVSLDRTGSYLPVILIFFTLLLLATATMLTIPSKPGHADDHRGA